MAAKRPPSPIERRRGGAAPVRIKLPNAATRAAIRQALEGEDLSDRADLPELKAMHG
jgi:hypothetical protein